MVSCAAAVAIVWVEKRGTFEAYFSWASIDNTRGKCKRGVEVILSILRPYIILE